MLMQLGKSYTTSLTVIDTDNNRVSLDTPVIIIKDTQTKKFWNGFMWSDSEFFLYLTYIDNGVYSYSFTPDKIGRYEILLKSDNYGISRSEMLEVFSGEVATYPWTVGTQFTIKHVDIDKVGSATVSIKRVSDNLYFDGQVWGTVEIVNNMGYLDGGVYSYLFTPESEDKYEIIVQSGTSEQIFILDVKVVGDTSAPITVNSSNFLSNNGSDCIVLSDSNTPLTGVQVSAFDFNTKDLIARTVTNQSGQWTLLLKPGQYYFLFEKKGYASVGFERMVM